MFNLFDKNKLHMDNSKASFLVPTIIFFMAGTGISVVSSDFSSVNDNHKCIWHKIELYLI